MKPILWSVLVFLLSALLNLAVFFVSYWHLTFPYLHEEQRMDNAPQIFLYVVPSYFGIALILAAFVYFLVRKKSVNIA